MPIFEYRCPQCDNVFEELVNDRSATIPCPSCGHKETEKLMSAIGGISMGVSYCGGSPCSSATSCGSGGCCPHAAG